MSWVRTVSSRIGCATTYVGRRSRGRRFTDCGLTGNDVPKDNPGRSALNGRTKPRSHRGVPARSDTICNGGYAMTGAIGLESELIESKKKMISGTYLRNAWYVAAWSDDLADGQLLARTILKEPVVLYRKADGKVAAMQDRS